MSERVASVVRTSDSGGATTRTVFVSDDVVVIRATQLRGLLEVAGDQATLAEALGVSRSTISRALAEAGEQADGRQKRIETVRALLGPEQTAGKNDATPGAALAPEGPTPPSGALPAAIPSLDPEHLGPLTLGRRWDDAQAALGRDTGDAPE